MATNDKDKDDNLKYLCKDYAAYVKVDAPTETKLLEDEIDDLMNKLDDFSNVINLIRQDSNVCYDEIMPAINKQYQLLNGETFAKIDKYEEFLNKIQQQADKLENEVEKAEDLMGVNKLSKVFGSFFNKKQKSSGTNLPEDDNNPIPEVFKSSDIFSNTEES